MASMKRIKTDLLALGLAAATMAMFADHADPRNNMDSKRLTLVQARAESAPYLDGPALGVLDRELLEVELRPSR